MLCLGNLGHRASHAYFSLPLLTQVYRAIALLFFSFLASLPLSPQSAHVFVFRQFQWPRMALSSLSTTYLEKRAELKNKKQKCLSVRLKGASGTKSSFWGACMFHADCRRDELLQQLSLETRRQTNSASSITRPTDSESVSVVSLYEIRVAELHPTKVFSDRYPSIHPTHFLLS